MSSSTRHGTGFWVIAAVFLTSMAFSTVPTPLYPIYQREDGFTAFTVTVIFAVYAVGVVTSLLLAGHVSDWLGRKRVLLPALGLEAVAAVLFLVWPALPGLLVARFLTGLGVGLITATATAYLLELHAAHRPGAGRGRFELVSAAANLGGLGTGTLVAGALAQFVDGPLRTPYVVFLMLLIVSGVAVAAVPETVIAPAPSFVAGALHHPSRLLAGTVSFLVFGAGALTQAVSGRIGERRRFTTGLTAEAAGLVVLALGMHTASLPLFLLGGAVAGGGAGLLFKSAVGAVAAMAPAHERGEALAGLFLIGYLGLIGPALGLGVATRYLPATTAMLWFTGVVLALLGAIALVSAASRRGKEQEWPPTRSTRTRSHTPVS